ncbi:MAG: UvrY/SirA/GacA family response regulator transcription factor [Pseudomonadales bacterium]|nr:UvrY/SirA/GacA family response regulator transcription factor [Pseudomonadales bacterium]
MEANKSNKVLVVDDHQLVRVGTSRLLADVEGIDIIGQAGSGEEAIDMVKSLKPDVVLMDVQMPGIGGLEATRRCLRVDPELKVIAVTIHEEEPYPSRRLQGGVSGYLTKKADVDEMVRAIRKVVAGQRYINPEIAQQLALRPYVQDEGSPFDVLSSREMQITLMVIGGLRVPEISDNLCLSTKTINSYRYRIFEKLGIKNDVALTKLAIKHGLIDAEAVA